MKKNNLYTDGDTLLVTKTDKKFIYIKGEFNKKTQYAKWFFQLCVRMKLIIKLGKL